jgi:hypothetical protein
MPLANLSGMKPYFARTEPTLANTAAFTRSLT